VDRIGAEEVHVASNVTPDQSANALQPLSRPPMNSAPKRVEGDDDLLDQVVLVREVYE